MLGGAVPLPTILEPIANLGGGETGALRELSLLARRRIRIGGVPFPQDAPRLLLEAVRGLLAVPDRPRQRKLAAHPVLPFEKRPDEGTMKAISTRVYAGGA